MARDDTPRRVSAATHQHLTLTAAAAATTHTRRHQTYTPTYGHQGVRLAQPRTSFSCTSGAGACRGRSSDMRVFASAASSPDPAARAAAAASASALLGPELGPAPAPVPEPAAAPAPAPALEGGGGGLTDTRRRGLMDLMRSMVLTAWMAPALGSAYHLWYVGAWVTGTAVSGITGGSTVAAPPTRPHTRERAAPHCASGRGGGS